MSERWVVWMYSLSYGWSPGPPVQSRQQAREDRWHVVDDAGYPGEWVTIRRESAGAPMRRPSQTSIDYVRAALAGGDDD